MISGKMGKPHSIIQFNKATGKLEEPTLLLKTRSGKVLGNIPYTNLQFSFVGKGLDNLSFNVHKVVNGKTCEFWDKLIDLSIVDYRGYGQFEAHVTLNDENESIKSVVCESLETELGQHIIHKMHINDEEAITNSNANTEFVPTTLYDPDHPEYSLIHRVLNDKAPHWTVGGCSPKINISGTVYDSNSVQRTFTINGQTPYDFFDGEVSQEFGVIFTYDTYNRKVYCHNLEECVYDINTKKTIEGYHCINGVFYDEKDHVVTNTSNLAYCEGIGNDTNIFVSKSKLANALSMESEQGTVKNCFYVTGGDDIITNMVGAANLTGNEIFIFGNFQYDDMSDELDTALHEYMGEIESKQEAFTKPGGIYILDPTCKYDKETKTCRDSKGRVLTDALYFPYSGYDPDELFGTVYVLDPLAYYDAETNNYLTRDDTILNHGEYYYNEYTEPGLYTKYCHVVDRIQYLEHTKAPLDSSTSTTTALEQKDKLTGYFEENTNKVIITNSCSQESFSHVTNSIKSMIQVVCDLRYSVSILSGDSYPQSCTAVNKDTPTGTWTGYVRLERETDSTDNTEFPLSVKIKYCDISVHNTDENLEYCKQKMMIEIAKMNIAEMDFSKLDRNGLYNLLQQYNLASLKEFRNGFESCITLLKNLYSNADLDEDDFYDKDNNIINEAYKSDSYILATDKYIERRDVADEIYTMRKKQIEELRSQETTLLDAIKEEQTNSNLKTYLANEYGEESGTKLWKEFYSYIREDEYNNSNYISDGLSDSECLEKAKKLLDAAKNELSKACMIQYTVSGDLNNIFSQKQLECLHENFDLFNYIRAEIDEKIYKLRLTEIRFSYDTPEKLEVTFSQQIESVDKAISDTRKILEQSASIATSYPSTIRQAEQGSNAFKSFGKLRQEGLDSSKVLLMNSTSEEQTFGNAGLFCRETTDGGMYSGNQLAITHNGIYMTENGFNSIKTAFGKFKFDDRWVYGINTDVIIGDLIVGKNLKITNKGDSENPNKNGTVEITGDGIEITGGSLSSPKINGGYLCIQDDNYSVEIDPKHEGGENTEDGYLFCIRDKNNDGNNIIMGVDTTGMGYFNGRIEAQDIKIGDFYDYSTGIDYSKNGMLINRNGLIYSVGSAETQKASSYNNGYTRDLCYVGTYKFDVPVYENPYWYGFVIGRDYIGYAKTTDSNLPTSNNIEPDGTTSIAADSIQTETLYVESQVNTSDKRLKTDIQPISKPVEFIQSLQPCEFHMVSGKSGRKHFGFLAQDVEEALSSSTGDAGVLVKYPNKNKVSSEQSETIDFSDDTTYTYGLRYDEFIAPMVATIQDLYKQVDDLKAEIKELKQKTNEN